MRRYWLVSTVEGLHCSVVSMLDLWSGLLQGGLGTQWECFDGMMGLEGEWVEGLVSYGKIDEARGIFGRVSEASGGRLSAGWKAWESGCKRRRNDLYMF